MDAGESIIGDGGLTYALERRGYVTAGEWTPEVVVEYPDAGKILSRILLFLYILSLQYILVV